MKRNSSPAAETAALSWFCGLAAGALNLGMGGAVTLGVLQIVLGRQPEFNHGQLLGVVSAGAVFGLVLAPAFVQARRYFQGGPLRQGALFGMILLALLLTVAAPVVLTWNDESRPWLVTSGAVLAAAAFVGYGTMLAVALDELRHPPARAPHASKCHGSRPATHSPRNCVSIAFSNSNN